MEVFAAEPPKLARAAEERGREVVENFWLRAWSAGSSFLLPVVACFPPELPPRDYFFKPRIIFTLREDRGHLIGFAGRAVIPGDEPKYLYSPGFPQSETLYRLDRVRSAIRAQSADKPQRIDVFAVEGMLDALRLESLGLNAVAILGTN